MGFYCFMQNAFSLMFLKQLLRDLQKKKNYNALENVCEVKHSPLG
jgi:hypothetical protein